MFFPASPASGGRLAAPKRAGAKSQKFVFPTDVVLIEPSGSATAS
jgi:hypothetical protein